MKYKVAIYMRKSTDSDDRQALSLDKQREACSDLMRGLDCDIIETFEESITGTKAGARPGFRQMMKLIKDGKVDTVVSWKMSRLARNALDQAYIETYLQEGKIKKILTTDGVFHPEDNVLLMRIYFGVATQYSKDLGKDASEGMLQKVKNGEAVKLPRGYSRQDGNTIKNIDSVAIKEAFSLKRQGMSYTEIGEALFRRFGLSSNSKPIASSTVHGIITNPFYYGAIKYLGEIFQGNHEPLVSYDDWKEANDMNSAPKSGELRDDLNFVRGLIKNHYTKNYLSPYLKKGLIYFRSSERGQKTINVSLGGLVRYFDEKIDLYKIPEEYHGYIIEGLREYFYEENGKIGDNKEAINSEIVKIDRKLANLLDMRMDGELDKEEYAKLKNEQIKRKFELSENLLKLEAIDHDLLSKAESCFELIVNLYQTWKQANLFQKVSIIKMICIELSYDHEKALHLAERELFREVRNLDDSVWLG